MNLSNPSDHCCDKDGRNDAIRVVDGIARVSAEHLNEPWNMFDADGFKAMYMEHVMTLYDLGLYHEAIGFIAYVFYEKDMYDSGRMISAISGVSDPVRAEFLSRFIKYGNMKIELEKLKDVLEEIFDGNAPWLS